MHIPEIIINNSHIPIKIVHTRETIEIRESPLLSAAGLQVHQEFRVIPELPLTVFYHSSH